MHAGRPNNEYVNSATSATWPQPAKRISTSTPSEILPAPVLQSQPDLAAQKRTRFKESTADWFRAGWQRVSGRFGADQILAASEADNDTDEVTEGDHYGAWWGSSKRGMALAEAEEIDEVVVEREWGDELKSCNTSEHGGEKAHNTPTAGGLITLSPVAERDSESTHSQSTASACKTLGYLRHRAWPAIYGFFDTRFSSPQSEEQYRRENWYFRKVRSDCHSRAKPCHQD